MMNGNQHKTMYGLWLSTLYILGLLVWAGVASCSGEPSKFDILNKLIPASEENGGVVEPPGIAPRYTYKVVNTYPHDHTAFTQGLLFIDGFLYEGTGQYGESTLRKVALESGDVLQLGELPEQFFGEGVTLMSDRLIQLTWRSRVGFVYDRESFALLRQFNYSTEGWGLTHDGRQLIMSDGSPTLFFLDPDTFAATGRLAVHDHKGPVSRLNELEYVRGEIYANIWQTDRIARISPQTGQVVGWIELEGLLSPQDRATRVDVLNGIAYDEKNDRLFVTGKWWPKLFEIELILSN
jgi:glutamine cyclotransferase